MRCLYVTQKLVLSVSHAEMVAMQKYIRHRLWATEKLAKTFDSYLILVTYDIYDPDERMNLLLIFMPTQTNCQMQLRISLSLAN